MVGSEPYTWSGCEQRKRKCWLQSSILSPCQRRDCLGKEVRYAFDIVLKHSRPFKVSNYRNTPYWLSACWTMLGTLVSPTVLLMSLSLPKSCSPGSGKVTYPHATVLMSMYSLSSSHHIVPQLW